MTEQSRRDPKSYPYEQPTESQLVLDDRTLPIRAVDPMSVGEWTVVRGMQGTSIEDALLRRLRNPFVAATYQREILARRRPVLAVGSNANPGVLRDKFAKCRGPLFVPMLTAKLHGFDTVYSSHVSRLGAVPATLYPSPGTKVRVVVLLLDEEQLGAMDESEPNYERMVFAPASALVSELKDVQLDAAYVYVSRYGALAVEGNPRRLEAIEATEEQFAAMSEPQALDVVRSRLGMADEPFDRFVETFADPATAVERNEELKGEALEPSLFFEHGTADLEVVETTPGIRDAQDDYVVVINPKLNKELGLGNRAVVICDATDGLLGLRRLAAPCRIVESKELKMGKVAADQSLRNAIGVPQTPSQDFDPPRPTPLVGLRPTKRLRPRSRDRFAVRALKSRYLLMRVAPADVPDMEKGLARIPEDAFRLLGSTSGDRLRVSSVAPLPDGAYEVNEVGIHAYGLADGATERRAGMEKPYIGARYPAAENILDVRPDIHPIYLDAHDRESLAVDPLDVVTVRRDVNHLLRREAREFGATLFISALGLQVLFGDLVVTLIVTFAITVFLGVLNIRERGGL